MRREELESIFENIKNVVDIRIKRFLFKYLVVFGAVPQGVRARVFFKARTREKAQEG